MECPGRAERGDIPFREWVVSATMEMFTPSGSSRRMVETAFSPSMTGMLMSISMQLKRSVRQALTVSRPFSAHVSSAGYDVTSRLKFKVHDAVEFLLGAFRTVPVGEKHITVQADKRFKRMPVTFSVPYFLALAADGKYA